VRNGSHSDNRGGVATTTVPLRSQIGLELSGSGPACAPYLAGGPGPSGVGACYPSENGRSRPVSMNSLPLKWPKSTRYSSTRSSSSRAECSSPISSIALRLTTRALRPSKSTFPLRWAASFASSYVIPVGLPSSAIRGSLPTSAAIRSADGIGPRRSRRLCGRKYAPFFTPRHTVLEPLPPCLLGGGPDSHIVAAEIVDVLVEDLAAHSHDGHMPLLGIVDPLLLDGPAPQPARPLASGDLRVDTYYTPT
jgi:hypothetical protein